MKRRIVGLALALCLLVGAIPWTARAEAGAIEISDAAGLAAIAEDLAGHYVLTQDIDLTAAWTPITALAGDDFPTFTGTLDGGGHTVRNLTMAEGTEFASLLGDIDKGAEIRNLRVELGAQGAASDLDASGLVSYMYGGTIQNCSVSGVVVNRQPEDCYAGALVAYMTGGTVSGCFSTGSVSGGCAGGLIGYIEGGMVKDSYALAQVAGATAAGGLAGGAEQAALRNCYAAGAVSATEALGDVGGLLGMRESDCTLTDCFYQVVDVLSGSPAGIGSDHGMPGDGLPEGKDKPTLTSGSPLAASWDMDTWYFSTGAYPQLQWARTQTEAPLAPPPVSAIDYQESEALGSHALQFPAVAGAVAYRIEIWDRLAQAGSARFAPPATEAAQPLYTGLYTPATGATAINVRLDDMLTAAAAADIARHPQKAAFSYGVSITALGSGNAEGDPSEPVALPEMQRLTGVDALEPIICERGDALVAPAALDGVVAGQRVHLPILWAFPYDLPDTADFVGLRTFSAPLALPLRVLNPDGYMAEQAVEAYATFAPPHDLAWDGAQPGVATWQLPDDPGGAVWVCLLDEAGRPVSTEKLIPRQVVQQYDFNPIIRQLGTGRYYFRVKAKASVDGYTRESGWAVTAQAYAYAAPDGGDPTAPGPSASPTGGNAPPPGSSTPQPGSGASQPGNSTPQPGSSTAQPGSSTPQPGSSTPRPGNGSPPTGDKGDLGPALLLLLASSGALLCIARRRDVDRVK